MDKAIRGKFNTISNREISPGIFELCLKAPEIAGAASAGQFVNIYLPGGIMLLPRPIGIADAGADTLTLVYAIAGKGTMFLSQIAEGGEVEIMGPFGKGFFDYPGSPVDEGFVPGHQEGLQEFSVLLIGGGTGIPLLYFASRKLKTALRGRVRLEAVFGFRECPWYTDMFEYSCDVKKVCSETEGMAESHGNVVDLLNAEYAEPPGFDLALAVGPRPMLSAVSQWCGAANIPLRVSLEERMGCGYGACAGCTQETRLLDEPSKPQNGPKIADAKGVVRKKVCVHGPVFWADEVIW